MKYASFELLFPLLNIQVVLQLQGLGLVSSMVPFFSGGEVLAAASRASVDAENHAIQLLF